MTHAETPVHWRETGDPRVPYAAVVGGEEWRVAVTEFPDAETPYVLLIDGRPAASLASWPEQWMRPRPAGAGTLEKTTGQSDARSDDIHERATYEEELEHLERTLRVRPSRLVERPPREDGPDERDR